MFLRVKMLLECLPKHVPLSKPYVFFIPIQGNSYSISLYMSFFFLIYKKEVQESRRSQNSHDDPSCSSPFVSLSGRCSGIHLEGCTFFAWLTQLTSHGHGDPLQWSREQLDRQTVQYQHCFFASRYSTLHASMASYSTCWVGFIRPLSLELNISRLGLNSTINRERLERYQHE
jgi:hypothetical protein